jgi:ATP-dependent helicase/nuclease subunit A
VRAHAGIALWPTGEQALANCLRLVDLARRFEKIASSFRAFVEQIERDAEGGEASEAPIVEEGTEGVRVMTVHKAKGLEFPVVILADPTCPAARDTPSRHVEPSRRLWLEPLCGCAPAELLEAADEELRRDRAEEMRVVYVAATRARDLLVVPTCGDVPISGWLEVLHPVLYPTEDKRRQAGPAAGCPEFGLDSVLDRGDQGNPPAGDSIRPGLHNPAENGPPAVWWDPTALELDVQEQAPLRQQRILGADADGTSEKSYASWKAARDEAILSASRPSKSVETVTALARAQPREGQVEVEIVTPADVERPGGKRFGTLVHAVLSAVDLNATPEMIRRSVSVSARQVDATDREAEAAVVAVTAALKHPLIIRAAAAQDAEFRRETPIVLRRADGTLVEGIVDLAFRENYLGSPHWTVVDFKTGREFEANRSEYAKQVSLYATAIELATKLPTRGILLVI